MLVRVSVSVSVSVSGGSTGSGRSGGVCSGDWWWCTNLFLYINFSKLFFILCNMHTGQIKNFFFFFSFFLFSFFVKRSVTLSVSLYFGCGGDTFGGERREEERRYHHYIIPVEIHIFKSFFLFFSVLQLLSLSSLFYTQLVLPVVSLHLSCCCCCCCCCP